jgi:glycosyltransferase involved in cell wall biosynthesis
VCSSTAYEQRRVIYLGHLVARQGVGALLDAVALLHERGADVTADIIGRGPIEDELRARAESHGIASHVHFHGFVEDHTEVERILAGASIAVAPYDPAGDTFTRWADPGKLKSYLAAGLPIVLTDVPPNARELADRGAADIVAFRADDIANAIGRLLDAPDVWRARHTAARRVAAEFDWSTILPPVLSGLGIATAPREEER